MLLPLHAGLFVGDGYLIRLSVSDFGRKWGPEMLENSPTDSQPVARTHRSRVTNGKKFLANVDGRSVWARRARDIVQAHVSDLGGADNTSEAERSIVRRAAAIT